MKKIPSTIVIAILCIIFASWPNIEAWGELSLLNHLLVHAVFLISGGLVGLQTAWWVQKPNANYVSAEESGVSS